MCRRSDSRWLAACAVAVAMALAGAARGDEVAAYLEVRGLTSLLVVHLEQQLPRADVTSAAAIVDRLATLYAQLLESAVDPATRRDLQERGRRLLASAPGDSADELRLALLRGSYQQVESAAENHRLRLTSPEELDRAKGTLAELIPQLHQLRDRLAEQVERAERQLSRSGGAEAVLLSSEAEGLRRLRSQATFLLAWSLTYEAWLQDRRESAMAAQRLFFEVLDTETPEPRPEEISVDLRGLEPIARAILGVALCKSMTASASTALLWLALLDHPQTFAPMRDEAPAWRLAIVLEGGDFAVARRIWEQLRARSEPIPLAWIRLAAVHALEAPADQPDAQQILGDAVSELAGRGELQQILALADRYGADRLGGPGFALRYVRGLQAYQRARARHGGQQPARDEASRALFQQAADDLRAALQEPDAARHAEAAAGAQSLLGWCRYFQGDLLAAREAFETASRLTAGDQAAESLWMAIVCLDSLVQARENEALSAERDALIDRFLAEHPLHARAPHLVLKKAQAVRQPSWEMIEDLLAVPEQSPVWLDSRRRAAELLLSQFRLTSGEQRRETGAVYLEVALALLAHEAAAVESPGAGGEGAARFVGRARGVLHVALDESILRLDAARRALDLLDSSLDPSAGLRTAHEDEFESRRTSLSLHEGDATSADLTARRLMERWPDSPWTLAASHAVFRHAVNLRARGTASAEEDRVLLQMIVEHGLWIRAALSRQPAGEPSRALAFTMAVAEAQLDLWTRHQRDEHGAAGLALHLELLAHRPRDPALLRGAAILGERFGEKPAALEHWRALLTGTAVGSEPWFEAKFHVLSLLSELEPARAREVMDQHTSLHPDYGPEPWRSRLKALDEAIPAGTKHGREVMSP